MTEIIKKFISKDLYIRTATLVSTDMVAHIQNIQKTSPIPTVAIGRAVTGALLMAAGLKKGHKIGLHFNGQGPLKTVFAEANFLGECRGCTGNPELDIPLQEKNIKVGQALGNGQLTVAHNQLGKKGRYSGTVEFASGEIADDIALFLYQSQQIPSLVSLGVYLDEFARVKAAGGIIMELMPGAPESTIEKLEKNAMEASNISELIMDGKDATDIAKIFMKDFEIEDLEFDQEVKYRCECSIERVKRSLKCLDPKDHEKIIQGGENVDITCEFCGKVYRIP
ncbi:MAG: Hsp33 family molecular chaperone HslO [Bacteriovoracaceae bacterium]|nr:Hsp33 family molecular chaperone HslO [Bacteriovoracaceae bacterium]